MSRLQTNAIRHLGSAVDNLTLDNAGRVLMPQQPVFHARGDGYGTLYTTGTRNAGSGDSSVLVTNVGGNYSAGTGRFTAPVAGTYLFYVGASAGNTNGLSLGIRIQKNGVDVQYGLLYNTAYQGSQITTALQLVAGDYVEGLIVWNNSVSANIYNSFFGGHLIG